MNLRDEALLEDPSTLPQMRFLFNDTDSLDLTLILALAVVHLGNQNSSEKDKMRGSLRTMMESFLGYKPEAFLRFRKVAGTVADKALEST
jgi:hypothetical protein